MSSSSISKIPHVVLISFSLSHQHVQSQVLTIWPPKYFLKLPFSLCLHCWHSRLVLKWTASILESKLALLSILHSFARVVFPNAYLPLTCSCIKTLMLLPLGKAPTLHGTTQSGTCLGTQSPAYSCLFHTLIPISSFIFVLSKNLCLPLPQALCTWLSPLPEMYFLSFYF